MRIMGTEKDWGYVLDWNKAKCLVKYRLTRVDENTRQWLLDHPYHMVADLAVTYELQPIGMNGAVIINNQLLKRWGVDEVELFRLAEENTPCLNGFQILDLNEYIVEATGMDMGGVPGMVYILTNNHTYHGAGVLLYPEMLDFLRKRFGEFYILPSSIHEVLLVPADSNLMDLDSLKEMVETVNSKILEPGDYLSDGIYGVKNSKLVRLV